MIKKIGNRTIWALVVWMSLLAAFPRVLELFHSRSEYLYPAFVAIIALIMIFSMLWNQIRTAWKAGSADKKEDDL